MPVITWMLSSSHNLPIESCVSMEQTKPTKGYLNYISLLFFLAYGFIMLDANGVTFFSDILMEELHITAAQYSSLNSAIWCTKAVSSIVVGILADRSGLRKVFVSPLLFVAGALSILTAFSNSFILILCMRFVWGLCVGATLSMLVSIVSKNLIRNDLGARSGFISCGSAVIASTLGPMLLTQVVLRFTWRGSFVLTGASILIIAFLIQFTVKEVHCEKINNQAGANAFVSSVFELARNRSFMLCLLIGVFECAGKLTISIFGPLYLTEIMSVDPTTKGNLLSAMGLIYIPVSFIIPALADRFSAKKVMLITFLLCLITPLSMVLMEGRAISIATLVLFGNWAAATVSLFIYVIPGRALPEHLIGTANGIIMGVSVFVGGCVCPLILGKFADSVQGIRDIMWACSAMFMLCILLTAFLKENKKKA